MDGRGTRCWPFCREVYDRRAGGVIHALDWHLQFRASCASLSQLARRLSSFLSFLLHLSSSSAQSVTLPALLDLLSPPPSFSLDPALYRASENQKLPRFCIALHKPTASGCVPVLVAV